MLRCSVSPTTLHSVAFALIHTAAVHIFSALHQWFPNLGYEVDVGEAWTHMSQWLSMVKISTMNSSMSKSVWTLFTSVQMWVYQSLMFTLYWMQFLLWVLHISRILHWHSLMSDRWYCSQHSHPLILSRLLVQCIKVYLRLCFIWNIFLLVNLIYFSIPVKMHNIHPLWKLTMILFVISVLVRCVTMQCVEWLCDVLLLYAMWLV